jgi:hypothetical protein
MLRKTDSSRFLAAQIIFAPQSDESVSERLSSPHLFAPELSEMPTFSPALAITCLAVASLYDDHGYERALVEDVGSENFEAVMLPAPTVADHRRPAGSGLVLRRPGLKHAG